MVSIKSRSGLIATKLGTSAVFDVDGRLIPVTLLKVNRNVVIAKKTDAKHGYNAVAIGYGERKKMSRPLKGIAEKAGINSFALSREFRVTESALLDIGTTLDVMHFSKGQHVNVRSRSIGKGFAGVVKRYHFAGLEASHGVSVSHRSPGSTGQRQDPGRVFKNKKMAGHMGDKMITMQNLKVIDIDLALSVLVVSGAVPGAEGAIVCITDAGRAHIASIV